MATTNLYHCLSSEPFLVTMNLQRKAYKSDRFSKELPTTSATDTEETMVSYSYIAIRERRACKQLD